MWIDLTSIFVIYSSFDVGNYVHRIRRSIWYGRRAAQHVDFGNISVHSWMGLVKSHYFASLNRYATYWNTIPKSRISSHDGFISKAQSGFKVSHLVWMLLIRVELWRLWMKMPNSYLFFQKNCFSYYFDQSRFGLRRSCNEKTLCCSVAVRSSAMAGWMHTNMCINSLSSQLTMDMGYRLALFSLN